MNLNCFSTATSEGREENEEYCILKGDNTETFLIKIRGINIEIIIGESQFTLFDEIMD
jgi:hypothetical protein